MSNSKNVMIQIVKCKIKIGKWNLYINIIHISQHEGILKIVII